MAGYCARILASSLLVLLVASGQARGQAWESWRFAGDLDLDLRYAHRVEPGAGGSAPVAEPVAGALADTLVAGLTLDGYAGKHGVGWMLGLDSHVGAGLQGGFAYELDVRAAGLGVALGHAVRLGVTAGAGLQGVTGHVPFAVQFPVRARLRVNLGHRVHVGGWAGVRWVVLDSGRQSGAPAAPFGDELSAGVLLRIGKGGRAYRSRWGNGYFIGGTYEQRLGAAWWGAMLGYSIDTTFGSGL